MTEQGWGILLNVVQ